jgi:hypothetical protein
MDESRTIRFPVPGCDTPLLFERMADGRLLTISCEGRVYLDLRTESRAEFDGGDGPGPKRIAGMKKGG